MTLAVPMLEAAALSFNWRLHVGGARSDARLQRCCDLVVTRQHWLRQGYAADCQAVNANDVAVV